MSPEEASGYALALLLVSVAMWFGAGAVKWVAEVAGWSRNVREAEVQRIRNDDLFGLLRTMKDELEKLKNHNAHLEMIVKAKDGSALGADPHPSESRIQREASVRSGKRSELKSGSSTQSGPPCR